MRRRELVAEMRFRRGFSYGQMVSALAKLDPPIVTNANVLLHDVRYIEANWKQKLRPENFDARGWLGAQITRYEFLYEEAVSRLNSKATPSQVAALIHSANAALRNMSELLQDVGLVDRKLGELVIDPAKAAKERLPTAAELREIVDQCRHELNAIDAEYITEGERKLLYGDANGSEAERDNGDNTPDGGRDDDSGDRGSEERVADTPRVAPITARRRSSAA